MVPRKNDLNIRPKSEQDNAFLETLYRLSRPELLQLDLSGQHLETLMRMQFIAQQTSYRLKYPDAEHSIIEKKGEAIGYLIKNENSGATRLVYICLMPRECNQGYGRQLIQTLQIEAARMNKPLVLSVDPQNLPAKQLYYSSGFQAVDGSSANLEMTWSGSGTEFEN